MSDTTAAPGGAAPTQTSGQASAPTQSPTPAATQTAAAPAANSEVSKSAVGAAETPAAQTVLTEPAVPLPSEPAKPAEADASSSSPTEANAPQPVTYTDFKLPENVNKDDPTLATFSEVASKAGVSQEQAQAIIDAIGPKMAEALSAPHQQWQALNEQWANEARKDPEFGGHKLAGTLVQAGRLFDDFVGPAGSKERAEFNQFLEMTGAGNHPSFFRAIARMAAAWDEGNPVPVGKPAQTNRNPAQVLYPKQGSRANGAAAGV